MNSRLTCLTPTLVGDGERLSPIDYMVWKEHVNVLDQRRIFRLLSKGPRLDGYLGQLKKAEKLDFASWGGFAQNFADRRIPFEHPSSAAYWERARGDSLMIPTFARGLNGPYLPASAVKGALRTGMIFRRWSQSTPNFDRVVVDRPVRHPGEVAEDQALGAAGFSFMRAVSIADSNPASVAALKIYMLRTSTLESRGGRYELAWKQLPHGTAKVEDATPYFAEMAVPGTVFEGRWRENAFLSQPEIAKMLHWREPMDTARLIAAANDYAAKLLAIQKQYAAWTKLPQFERSVAELESRLESARSGGNACLLAMGWSSGLLAKTPWLDTENQPWRQMLRQIPLYSRALNSGLPFPKTRRLVFLNNQPATLPGWCLLEIR